MTVCARNVALLMTILVSPYKLNFVMLNLFQCLNEFGTVSPGYGILEHVQVVAKAIYTQNTVQGQSIICIEAVRFQ
jgi:hypothetical protein